MTTMQKSPDGSPDPPIAAQVPHALIQAILSPQLPSRVRAIVATKFKTVNWEDVYGEMVICALHNSAKFDVKRPAEPWLIQIASNLASNQARREKLRKHEDHDERRDPGTYDALHLQTEEQFELVRQAIEKLTEEEQNVLMMSDFHMLPNDVAAAELGISPEAFKSRLFRARKALREACGKA